LVNSKISFKSKPKLVVQKGLFIVPPIANNLSSVTRRELLTTENGIEMYDSRSSGLWENYPQGTQNPPVKNNKFKGTSYINKPRFVSIFENRETKTGTHLHTYYRNCYYQTEFSKKPVGNVQLGEFLCLNNLDQKRIIHLRIQSTVITNYNLNYSTTPLLVLTNMIMKDPLKLGSLFLNKKINTCFWLAGGEKQHKACGIY